MELIDTSRKTFNINVLNINMSENNFIRIVEFFF